MYGGSEGDPDGGSKLLDTVYKLDDKAKGVSSDSATALTKVSQGLDGVKGGTCCTGASPVSGGYSALVDYSNSVYSKAKEKLIRGIASDVATALKVNSKFTQTASIGKVVEKLQKFVPDPRKGKHFVKDSGSQIKVCRSLAKSINKRYGSNMIDSDAEPAAICKAVGELMYSLFTGLHTEFLTVSGDIGRNVRNLKALRDYVDATNKSLVQLVKESGTESQGNRADNIYFVYEKLRNEIDRQLAILTNNVNATTGPLGKTLVGLLEENNEFKGLVEDLRVSVGSDVFGDKLGYLLSGVSSVSHAAYLIDKALKTLGMSVSEYKSAKTLAGLREKVFKHMGKKSPGSAQLRKMLEAADIIYKTDYDHANIVKYLETKMSRRGGMEESGTHYSYGSQYDLNEQTERELGTNRGYMSRKSMGLQMKEHQHYRKMLFNDLKKLLRGHFSHIIESVGLITRKIGNEIPISDDLYKFVVRFGQVESVDRENLHIALSGYRKDVNSRHIKNKFMASLKAVYASLEPLKTGTHGQKFKDIQDAISQLVKSVDNFSDKFVKSLTEIPVDIVKKPRRGGMEIGQNMSLGGEVDLGMHIGGIDGDLGLSLDGGYGNADVAGSNVGGLFQESQLGPYGGLFSESQLNPTGGSDEYDYFTTMGKVQKELNYYYSIANLKSNLGRSSKELESYGEDYENILGDEIAAYVDQINKQFNREIELSDYEHYSNLSGTDTRYDDALKQQEFEREFGGQKSLGWQLKQAVALSPLDHEGAKRIAGTYKYVRTYQKNAKINLLKAAEALDLYMKKFTSSVVAHPDDIKDLVNMLSQISIVAKWFTNRTGDHLAAVFEAWPCDHGSAHGAENLLWSNGSNTPPGHSLFTEILGKKHYYEWISDKVGNGVGNPSIPWYPLKGHDEVKTIFRRIEKSYRGNRALENIVATFSRLGDKFGNKSIKDSSFMSHAQIYKALNDYLVASSVAMGATGISMQNREINKVAVSLQAFESSLQNSVAASSTTSRSVLMKNLGPYTTVVKYLAAIMIAVGVYKLMGLRRLAVPWKTRAAASTLVGLLVGAGVWRYDGRRGGAGDKTPPTWEERLEISERASQSMYPKEKKKLIENSHKVESDDMLKILNVIKRKFNDLLKTLPSDTREAQVLISKFRELESSVVSKATTTGKFAQAGFPGLFSQIKDLFAKIPGMDLLPDVYKKGNAALDLVGVFLTEIGGTVNVQGGAMNDTASVLNHSKIKARSFDFGGAADTSIDAVYDRVALTIRSTDPALSGYNNDFSDTDHIFSLMMKSMVCKVLTVVGLFTVFNRPGAINRSITPLRMILGAGVRGGGSSNTPTVIDDAVELYIRLPLLAEWYREKFGFKKTSSTDPDSDAYQVSMVPSFEGIWSDFVRLVFVDNDFVKDGTYTDMTLKKLISTINEIYKKYKSQYPKSTVREVINAFVTEINRRYGFVKKNEINAYLEETRTHIDKDHVLDDYPDEDRVDYDIIDEEGDYGRKPAPSDRFQTINPKSRRSHRFAEKQMLLAAVQRFREDVEEEMMSFSANFDTNLQSKTLADNKYSFVENILQVTQKLRNAKNNDDRYNIVRDAVQGVNHYAGISYEKTLMFNEVVITPLSVLTSVYDLLDKFTCFVHGTNTRHLQEIASGLGANQQNTMNVNNDPDSPNSIYNHLVRVMKAKYPHVKNTRFDAFVKAGYSYINSNSTYWDIQENENPAPIVQGDAFKQTGWGEINKHAWRRYGSDRKKLMKDLINALFCVGCDLNGLIEVRVSSSGAPIVDHSKLQELVVVMINQVKSSIGEFRNVLSTNTINKYESGVVVVDPSTNSRSINIRGSLLWLEENLIETLFNNRDKAGLPEVNESISATWADLNRPWNFDASDIKRPVALPVGSPPNRDTYDDVISGLLFWNYKKATSISGRNTSYNEFPAMYMPVFKSGNFDPVTHQEKLAFSKISRIPNGSVEVIKSETNYHEKNMKDAMTVNAMGFVLGKFTTLGNQLWPVSEYIPMLQKFINMTESLSAKITDSVPRPMKAIAGRFMSGLGQAASLMSSMDSFIRYFTGLGYGAPVFDGVANQTSNPVLNNMIGINARLLSFVPGVAAVPGAPRPGERVINFQACAQMLPPYPGNSYNTGSGASPFTSLQGSGIAAAISGLGLGIQTSAVFPQADASLSQIHLLGILLFGMANPQSFEAFNGNMYISRLHAVCKKMSDWFIQGIPLAKGGGTSPAGNALGHIAFASTFQVGVDALDLTIAALDAAWAAHSTALAAAAAPAGGAGLAPGPAAIALAHVVNAVPGALGPGALGNLVVAKYDAMVQYALAAQQGLQASRNVVAHAAIAGATAGTRDALAAAINDVQGGLTAAKGSADIAQQLASGGPAGQLSFTSYQARDQVGGAKTLSMFDGWRKELNDIIQKYMEERTKLDINLNNANTLSSEYESMKLVTSYRSWYFTNSTDPSTYQSENTGLIPVFNELLARYVTGFSDKTQFAKIYLPLLESFANGSNSREVMQGNGIRDMNFSNLYLNDVSNHGVKGDPPPNTLLYASLARVIKSILTRITLPVQNKYHLITNFVEVPEYLKEAMRASLPVFDKEFEYIKKKALFIKSIIETGANISVRRRVSATTQNILEKNHVKAAFQPEHGLHGGMLNPSEYPTSDQRVNYYVGLINSIVSGCNSIQRCSEIVQKELSDVPLYGETFEGSIKHFRNRYGKNPLTPLSSLTFLLNPLNHNKENWLTPSFSVGSAKFKNLYSTRLVLAQSNVDPRMDYLPGIKDIVHQYNGVSDRTTQAPSYYGSLFQQTVTLMRYLTDISFHKSLTGKFLDYNVTSAVGYNPAQYNYSSMEEVMGLTENNDTKTAAVAITRPIGIESENIRDDSRKTLRIYNILDLNIVPVNFHAMQREIPLINLYNYSYTFDRMIQESMVPNWNTSMRNIATDRRSSVMITLRPGSQVTNTRAMFAKCLMYPHESRTRTEYNTWIQRIMLGSSEMKLGRPKFNSDQLWGKVLLQDLYPYSNTGDYDEAGPTGEFSLLRGWQSARMMGTPGDSRHEDKLTYQVMDYSGDSKATREKRTVKISPHNITKLKTIGYHRYNTHIVRNMEWFVNLQRYMRYTMRESLKWMDTPVVRGHNVLNSKITEYVESESYNLNNYN